MGVKRIQDPCREFKAAFRKLLWQRCTLPTDDPHVQLALAVLESALSDATIYLSPLGGQTTLPPELAMRSHDGRTFLTDPKRCRLWCECICFSAEAYVSMGRIFVREARKLLDEAGVVHE